MALSNEKIKKYRTIGHGLKPVVMISDQGLTEGVLLELERALNDHELIKVKINCGDRETKKSLISELCNRCQCERVQAIGNMVLIYRVASRPNPRLSNILRAGKF